MSLSIILFIASGICLIVFVGLKMLQERLGLLLFWPDTREKFEIFFRRKTIYIRKFIGGFSRRSIYIVLHYVLSKLRTFALYILRKIDKRLVHLVNLIKGRQMIDATRGKASHFLNDISRFKDKFRRQ